MAPLDNMAPIVLLSLVLRHKRVPFLWFEIIRRISLKSASEAGLG